MFKKILVLVAFVLSIANLKSETKTLILDLGGIFFNFSKLEYAKNLGLNNMLWYLASFKNPGKLQNIIFNVLEQVELKQDPEFKRTATTSGVRLPYLTCLFQAGQINSVDAQKLALDKLEELSNNNFFSSQTEKELVKLAIIASFTPTVHEASIYKLEQGIELLKELANAKNSDGSKKYKLIALSNWDKESFELVKKKFQNEFSNFDELVISGDIGTIKPNFAAFEFVIKKFNLEKSECIFMDDQKENISAAEEFGIKSILYANYEQARAELEKLEILPKIQKAKSYYFW